MAKRICLVLSFAVVAWCDVIYKAYTPSLLIFLDFSRRNDVRFLNSTMPWIIEKVGTHVKTNYQFINYGNIPELVCGSRHLKKNSLHQAIYHICHINKGKKCFTKFGIFEEEYKSCILNDIQYYHQDAIAKFRRRGLRSTPALFIEKQFVKNLEQESLLNRICAAFLRKPSGCPGQEPVKLSAFTLPNSNLLARFMQLRAQQLNQETPPEKQKKPPARVNNVATPLRMNPERRHLRLATRMPEEPINNAGSLKQENYEARRVNNEERQFTQANSHAIPQKRLNTKKTLQKPENKQARPQERVNKEATPLRRANNKEMLRQWGRRP